MFSNQGFLWPDLTAKVTILIQMMKNSDLICAGQTDQSHCEPKAMPMCHAHPVNHDCCCKFIVMTDSLDPLSANVLMEMQRRSMQGLCHKMLVKDQHEIRIVRAQGQPPVTCQK